MAERIEDEQLVALADGELPAEAAEQLQKLVDQDPDAAARLEAFKASRDALRAMFNSESLEPTPAHIAEKIRGMGKQEEAIADVVQFDIFKKRRERVEEQRRFSFKGIQRYAAVLILGVTLGYAGNNEFDRTEQGGPDFRSEEFYQQNNQTRREGTTPSEDAVPNTSLRGLPAIGKFDATKSQNISKFRTRNYAPAPAVIKLMDMEGNAFFGGEFVPKGQSYRLFIKINGDINLTILKKLEYVEGSEPPEILISERSFDGDRTVQYPEERSHRIQFDTEQNVVSFILTLQTTPVSAPMGLGGIHNPQQTLPLEEKYIYSFGLKD